MGKEDIYVSRLVNAEYQSPSPLDTNINTATYEFNAFVSPDEDLLIFGSYGRPDDLGGGDLYISRRESGGSWGKAYHPGAPVNSDRLDYCPFIDFPRGNFYFTSEREEPFPGRINTVEELEQQSIAPQNGLGDLYRIAFSQLRIE